MSRSRSVTQIKGATNCRAAPLPVCKGGAVVSALLTATN